MSKKTPANVRATRHLRWISGLGGLAVGLAACGGGGDDPPPPKSSYFAIEGARTAGGVPMTVCVDGLTFTDPNGSAGQVIARNLATYYAIVGGYRSYSGDGRSCRERFSVVDVLIGADDYIHVVVPAVAVGQIPAPPAPQPSPQPAPAPPPAAINCSNGSGSGVDGLQLYGTATHGPMTTAASMVTTVALDPGEIGFSNPAFSSAATTGSLRARLWAVRSSFAGGGISGYVVSDYTIRFADGGNQLHNGQSSNLVEQVLSAQTPPAGAYCLVVTLEEYDSRNCGSSDNYCIADWAQFPASVSFR